MVAVLTALLVIFLPAIPIRPPLKKPPDAPAELAALDVPAELAAPRPNVCPANPATVETPRAAIMTSASIELPVRPTLTPRLAMKLSIFCDTFRKATAHRNQISTFPVTASLLDAATAASTSLSSRARAGTQNDSPRRASRSRSPMIVCFFIKYPPIKVTADWPKRFRPCW